MGKLLGGSSFINVTGFYIFISVLYDQILQCKPTNADKNVIIRHLLHVAVNTGQSLER
jgi:hypothetical protein